MQSQRGLAVDEPPAPTHWFAESHRNAYVVVGSPSKSVAVIFRS